MTIYELYIHHMRECLVQAHQAFKRGDGRAALRYEAAAITYLELALEC